MPIFNRHLIGWACLTDSMITGQFTGSDWGWGRHCHLMHPDNADGDPDHLVSRVPLALTLLLISDHFQNCPQERLLAPQP